MVSHEIPKQPWTQTLASVLVMNVKILNCHVRGVTRDTKNNHGSRSLRLFLLEARDVDRLCEAL